jgi:hypothetical protein
MSASSRGYGPAPPHVHWHTGRRGESRRGIAHNSIAITHIEGLFRCAPASERCRPDLHTADKSELGSISIGTREQRSWSLQAVEGASSSKRKKREASQLRRLSSLLFSFHLDCVEQLINRQRNPDKTEQNQTKPNQAQLYIVGGFRSPLCARNF